MSRLDESALRLQKRTDYPLHITLVPPFYLDEKFSERTLFEARAEAASAWGAKSKTLCCAVNGFGAF